MAETEANVIVAIPAKDDYVWKLSSEKVPHMTLLYLEDLSTDPNLETILQFLSYAVDSMLHRFYLDVDSRGVLGSDSADVLFFGGYGLDEIKRFRQTLLLNSSIKAAYNAVRQYPEWTPHLTMGYPATPAKKDSREYPGLNSVRFDRIALWTEDYKGFEIPLSSYDYGMEVSMSDLVSDILSHHGVKGQKWGVRRDGSISSTSTATSRLRRPATDVVVKQKPGQFVRTSGGKKQSAAEDAIKVASARQVAKKSSTDALTTKQLQEAVKRMNLEVQYSKLVKQVDRRNRGKRFVDALLGNKHPSETINKNGSQSGSSSAAKVAAALAKKATSGGVA